MPLGVRPGPWDWPVAAQQFGRLRIEYHARAVALDGRLLALTRSEFDLLAILTTFPRVVITREQLLSELWETTWLGDVTLIEVHVSRLRSKLGETGLRWHFIQTIRGLGYMFTQYPDDVTWPDGASAAAPAPDAGVPEPWVSPVIAFIGLGGLLAWVSTSAMHVLGRAPTDLVGSLWTDLAHADDLPMLATAWLGLLAVQPQVLQVRIRDAAGRHRPMLAYLTPMTFEEGPLAGVVVEWHPVVDSALSSPHSAASSAASSAVPSAEFDS
ncbi:MAG: winged helix-turn-helix domain-containing protein [Actinomycetales bacterium]|nr:winged helix-turn-helix domain-containing protein [Actinomycetales bacterium]